MGATDEAQGPVGMMQDALLQDENVNIAEEKAAEAKREKRALCCSVLTLLLSIPALIGA